MPHMQWTRGVDAIMLAGETAVGLYPIKAVQTLDAIIRDAETMPLAATSSIDGIALARQVTAGRSARPRSRSPRVATPRAIVAMTRGGKTARLLSALRPPVPIYAATDQPAISRLLTLAWGVVPVLADLSGESSEAASRIGRDARRARVRSRVDPSSSWSASRQT